MLRTFDCPETEQPCSDGRCSKELCCEREKLHAASKREAAAKKDRINSAKVMEIIGPIIKR